MFLWGDCQSRPHVKVLNCAAHANSGQLCSHWCRLDPKVPAGWRCLTQLRLTQWIKGLNWLSMLAQVCSAPTGAGLAPGWMYPGSA